MGKQFNIRSEKARGLAISWSERTGKSLAQVVEEALMLYDPPESDAYRKERLLRPLAEAAQRASRESPSDFRLDDLYDPDTGLPI